MKNVLNIDHNKIVGIRVNYNENSPIDQYEYFEEREVTKKIGFFRTKKVIKPAGWYSPDPDVRDSYSTPESFNSSRWHPSEFMDLTGQVFNRPTLTIMFDRNSDIFIRFNNDSEANETREELMSHAKLNRVENTDLETFHHNRIF